MQDRRSEGTFSRNALDPAGTMVLGDGAATRLVFVSRALLARICEDPQARARTVAGPYRIPHFHFISAGVES